MGDGLTITHGNAIAVDSSMLREASRAWAGVAARVTGAVAGVQVAGWMALCAGAWHCLERCDEVSAAATSAAVEMSDVAIKLNTAADLYELAEMAATPEAWASDPTAQARFDELMGEHSAAAVLITSLMLQRATPLVGKVFREENLFGLGPLGWHINHHISKFANDYGFGTIEQDERLLFPDLPVTLVPLAPKPFSAAPSTITGGLERIPQGGDARIRVEKYTLPDGEHRYVTYVSGTVGILGDEPFDMVSNAGLYMNAGATSYTALVQALAAAGAKPGDRVSQFAYSQGAMVTGRLAVEGPYRVDLNVNAGAPVSTELPRGTLQVDIAHDDDLVAALRDRGLQYGQANPNSILVTRTADVEPMFPDLGIGAHAFDKYLATAELLDASPDVRITPAHDSLAELDDAVAVEVFEFGAVDAEHTSQPPVVDPLPPKRLDWWLGSDLVKGGDAPRGDGDG